jgi:quercetin dioxygenase-like cupin family protein
MERKAIVRRVEDTKEESRGDVEKRVFFTPGKGSECVRFSYYRAKPGIESDLHTNKGDDCTYIMQGAMKIEAGGETYHVKEGDAFYMPSDLPHKATIVGDQEFRIITAHCDMCALYMEKEEKERRERAKEKE